MVAHDSLEFCLPKAHVNVNYGLRSFIRNSQISFKWIQEYNLCNIDWPVFPYSIFFHSNFSLVCFQEHFWLSYFTANANYVTPSTKRQKTGYKSSNAVQLNQSIWCLNICCIFWNGLVESKNYYHEHTRLLDTKMGFGTKMDVLFNSICSKNGIHFALPWNVEWNKVKFVMQTSWKHW